MNCAPALTAIMSLPGSSRAYTVVERNTQDSKVSGDILTETADKVPCPGDMLIRDTECQWPPVIEKSVQQWFVNWILHAAYSNLGADCPAEHRVYARSSE